MKKPQSDTTVRLENHNQTETPTPVAQTLSALDKQDIAPSPHFAETIFIFNSNDKVHKNKRYSTCSLKASNRQSGIKTNKINEVSNDD